MTEAKWLACVEPEPMLEFLLGRASDRKLRLFGVACCRRIWSLISNDGSRNSIETEERFQDGSASSAERSAARAVAQTACRIVSSCNSYREPRVFAIRAAYHVSSKGRVAVRHIADNAARARAVSTGPTDPWKIYKRAALHDEMLEQCGLLRDIFENPFRTLSFSPDWCTSTAVALAAQMYESRDFGAMPILADALQDAGCDNADVLDHCRDANVPHVRGCWVVDLVLGRE